MIDTRTGTPLVRPAMSVAFILAVTMFGACGGTPDEKGPFAARTDDENVAESNGALVVATEKSLGGDPSAAASVDAGGGGDAGSFDTGPGDTGPIDDGGFDGAVDGGPQGGPTGFWKFDDCSPTSNFLLDSSGGGANATHALKRSCKPGISGQAVEFTSTKDIVQVPDEPQFTLDKNVAVAAWINPTSVTGDHPVLLKRLNNKTAVSLGIHNGNIEFSVVLTTGTTVLSRAPVTQGVWTHVAGLYDGRFLFLFVNGEQVGQVLQAGTVRNVFAPLRIGATTGSQHFDGLIDEVWFSNRVVSKDELMALACIPGTASVSVVASTSAPVPPDTSVHYDVSLNNKDAGFCKPSSYFISLNNFQPGLSINVNPQFVPDVPTGGVAKFGVDVVGSEDADPGTHTIPFAIVNETRFDVTQGQLSFALTEPTGCHVSTNRELMITNTSVVDDPVRTTGAGTWTFGRLMRDMAPTPESAPAFTEKVFQTWMTDQTVNGFKISARPQIQNVLFANWPRTKTGELDLDQAPMRLLAIVNRVDVRDLSKGNAGEGRFVFGVLGPGNNPVEFTVIVEFKLPAKTEADVLDWANAWHALGALPFPSESYNAALEALTLKFSGRGVGTGPNGSSLGQLRTNEIALSTDKRWELREFTLSQTTGFLEPSPIQLTPDLSFNGTATLAQFVNDNASTIIAEKHTVPLTFNGAPFLGGSVFNDLVPWTAPGITDNEARFKFSMNTCNGCHSTETNTIFLQITNRVPGSEAQLSQFLTGTTVFDPVTGQQRTLKDLGRRKTDLEGLVCSAPATTATPATATAAKPAAPKVSIAKGIGRVH